jgi:predicted kinase
VYIPIGISGSGKSYWWENTILKNKDYAGLCKRIHLSRIRYDLLGDYDNLSKEDLVKKIALSNLKTFLGTKVPLIYVDFNNINKNFRNSLIKESKLYNYKLNALVFYKDVNYCANNLFLNKKNFDIQALESEFINFKENLPEFEEGWDDIFIIK